MPHLAVVEYGCLVRSVYDDGEKSVDVVDDRRLFCLCIRMRTRRGDLRLQQGVWEC